MTKDSQSQTSAARADIRNSFSQAESPEDLLLRIELLAETPLILKNSLGLWVQVKVPIPWWLTAHQAC